MGMHLENALREIASAGPEYGSGLSSHVPMVIESLDRLGRGDLLAPYLEVWRPRLRRLDPVLDADLGAYEGLVSEAALVVESVGPDEAVSIFAPRFLPGFHGAAFHGAIRVAHAHRATRRSDTPAVRSELAKALAYAVCTAEAALVDTSAGQARTGISFPEVLEGVRPPEGAAEGREGLITANFISRLGDRSSLNNAVRSIKLPASSSEALLVLRGAALDLFVRGEHHPSATFVLLHGITAADAVSTLAYALPEPEARQAVRILAGAVLALRLAYVPKMKAAAAPASLSMSELAGQAAKSMDDHAIKLAAACLDGQRALPDLPWESALEFGVRRFGTAQR